MTSTSGDSLNLDRRLQDLKDELQQTNEAKDKGDLEQ
jgi:hypothetical protein